MKIKMVYNGEADTILFSIKEKSFFSYEKDREMLHDRFGGCQCYTSHTGLSGEGFLAPPADHDLVMFGYYRTDIKGVQQQKDVVHTTDGGCPIWGYAPIASHKGISNDSPFVLTDGKKVALIPEHLVLETLLGWEGVEGKDYKTAYYRFDGAESFLPFQLYNPYRFRGINVVRFLNLRVAREDVVVDVRFSSLFEKKTKIIPIRFQGETNWFHYSPLGFFDQMWSKDPQFIIGEIANGYVGNGNGLFWRRSGTGVQIFFMKGGEEVEEESSTLEWFSRNINEWWDKTIR